MTLYVNGVNLLPATGEFTYGTAARQGQRAQDSFPAGINFYYSGEPSAKTDCSVSIDQLQAQFPSCTTVAIVCAWFGNSTDASQCKLYPSTTYIGGSFTIWNGSGWISENWQCSSLIQGSDDDLIPISSDSAGAYTYGGTPSDQSIVECIVDLKARGLRVVFYPFILMDSPGKPWRGRITYSPDVTTVAASAVSAFLGSAIPANFTQDLTNKTVSYSGPATDYTFRRMILHYANLCVIAGGVDLFLIGSELRGLETIRGPAWTNAGTADGSGNAVWDYPFVAGLVQLSDDVRSIFDAAGLRKDPQNYHNLISYAADWSDWMGYSHAASSPPPPDGQWPHLDQLWGHANIDFAAFDNYLPLSDWTTGANGGLDALNWANPAPLSWPPPPSQMSGLALTGTPTIYDKDYLKANIEGGERFNWFYFDSNNDGRGKDPFGSDLTLSLPEGDRLTQSRNPYFPNQQILAQKQLRWWWNNQHYALYDSGAGLIPQGNHTQWVAQSKPIIFTEYGFPAVNRSTNQPNVFYDTKSTESATAYWSIWEPSVGGFGFLPKQDQDLQLLALQAVYEYWFVDGHNATSAAGLPMIEPAFCSVWNWDARPFPTFPRLSNIWGDAGNWQTGNWLGGKGPYVGLPITDNVPVPAMPFDFPSLPGLSWSVHKKPTFSTRVASHVSGREVRSPYFTQGLYEFELTIGGMDSNSTFPGLGSLSLQALMGLFIQCQGQYGTFLYVDPTDNMAVEQSAGVQNSSGSVTSFTIQRAVLYGQEPISWVTGLSQAYVNGSAIPQYKLAEDSTNNQHYCTATDTPSLYGGWPFTVTCYVKPVERTQCVLGLFDGMATHFCSYDLVAVSASGSSGITGSIMPAANGWYLISAAVTIAAATTPSASLFLEELGTTTYLGIAGQGLNISSFMYSYANTAAAFFPTITAGQNATFTGPNWTALQPNTVTFASAPPANAAIAWDGTYAFNCRFTDDQEDFEEILNGLWQIQSLKFRSVKS